MRKSGSARILREVFDMVSNTIDATEMPHAGIARAHLFFAVEVIPFLPFDYDPIGG
jgi:hypothetical protein